MFVQGIYESRIASQFGPLVLLGLHQKAMKRNQEMGLTSFMYYDERRIFQVVEGERKKVSRMLGMIGRSALHDDLKVRAVLSRTERSFPHWPFGGQHTGRTRSSGALSTRCRTLRFSLWMYWRQCAFSKLWLSANAGWWTHIN